MFIFPCFWDGGIQVIAEDRSATTGCTSREWGGRVGTTVEKSRQWTWECGT